MDTTYQTESRESSKPRWHAEVREGFGSTLVDVVPRSELEKLRNEMMTMRGELRSEMADKHFELLKWLYFGYFLGSIVAVVALVVGVGLFGRR